MSNKNIDISIVSLVVANIFPIVGVLFFDWSIFQIIFLYWCESGIIGFFNIIKILKINGIYGIFLGLFFTVHYSGFMFVHLLFIITLFTPKNISFPLSESRIYPMVYPIINSIIALFVSHSISFVSNFIIKGEYKSIKNPVEVMMAPYKRIMIMHLTLLFGGFLIILLGKPILGIVLLLLLKTIIDINSHIKEHNKFKIVS